MSNTPLRSIVTEAPSPSTQQQQQPTQPSSTSSPSSSSPDTGADKTTSAKTRSQIATWTSWLFHSLRKRTQYAGGHWKKEAVILQQNWKVLVLCLIFQYVHSVATNVVYYLHVPRKPLYDLGFALLPALSPRTQVLSEIMFFALVSGTIGFALSPFVVNYRRPRYFFVMFTRFATVCALAQALRIVSFTVTVLPGPNYHCRPGSTQYDPPQTVGDMLFRQDAFLGCGDLVFSSHTIFVLLCALTITKYAPSQFARRFIWVLVFIFGILVVAARKHYSLDIVAAWYTVPLLWIAYDTYYPDRLPPALQSSKQSRKPSAILNV